LRIAFQLAAQKTSAALAMSTAKPADVSFAHDLDRSTGKFSGNLVAPPRAYMPHLNWHPCCLHAEAEIFLNTLNRRSFSPD
jgi:hypothetical protein